MDEIVFICTGNTCRSPMAEGFFRALGGETRLRLQASSAGLFTQNGICATEHAVAAAGALGADIAAHKSAQLTGDTVAAAKYLVCMTGAHFDELLLQYPQAAGKIFMLSQNDISDPFGGDIAIYNATAKQIYASVKQLILQMENDA